MGHCLAGRRIVITRPVAQAQAFAQRVREAGGEPVLFPLLEITALEQPDALQQAASFLRKQAAAPAEQSRGLTFFVSPNAVHFAMRELPHPPAWPAGWSVSTVGPSSEAALAQYGFARIIAPQDAFDSEAVLRLPEMQEAVVSDQTVLIFRGEGGRELLGDTLQQRGAQVRYIPCYRRSCPVDSAAPLLAQHQQQALDALTLTSSEGVSYLGGLLGRAGIQLLQQVPVFVPHVRIAQAAQRLGFQQVELTAGADQGLWDGLCAYFS